MIYKNLFALPSLNSGFVKNGSGNFRPNLQDETLSTIYCRSSSASVGAACDALFPPQSRQEPEQKLKSGQNGSRSSQKQIETVRPGRSQW